MIRKRSIAVVSLAAVACALLACAIPASAQMAGSVDSVDVRDVAVSGDTVTGTVVNRSSREVRDVELMVTRAWLWRDERHPGDINPGGSYPFKVAGPVPPGGSVKFTYEVPGTDVPSSLGSFEVSVAVQGYTEVEYRMP
ncbi:MAG TPA: hypothetical protein VFD92_11550 [Candidatus Binatia bacterium]|nr:hypothetical protein [Candidatus Binatia bacterium]